MQETVGLNTIQAIEMIYAGKGKEENFLLFNIMWSTKKGDERVMGFGLPALFRYTKYADLQVHIDATFVITPHPFYQTLIWSIRDAGTGLHIPIFYVLMTTKTEEAYHMVYFQIKLVLGKIWFCQFVKTYTHFCNIGIFITTKHRTQVKD